MPLAAGALQTRITIQEETRVSDGQGGVTKTWGGTGHTWNAWSRKKFVSGGDSSESDQTVSRRRFEYTVRRRRDVSLSGSMRVVDGSVLLQVISVSADDDDVSAMRIVAEELPPDVVERTVASVVVAP